VTNIQYLHHKEIDKRKWDRCIANAINKSVIAHSWFLDIVSPGWDALVENDYESVFPLTHRTKFGIRYLCQPPFTQQLGLFTTGLLTIEKTDKFLALAEANFRLIEICLNSMNKSAHEDPVQSRVNILLDLIPEYIHLRKNYSDNLKRNLQKANNSNLRFQLDIDYQLIINLFSENRGKKIKNSRLKVFYTLSLLFIEGRQRQCAFSCGVFNSEGSLIAGALFFYLHERLIFLFSGLNEDGKKTGAMAFLIDQVIRKYAGTQTILDFEGSIDPGIARFYKSFGSHVSYYPMYTSNTLPVLVRETLKFTKRLK